MLLFAGEKYNAGVATNSITHTISRKKLLVNKLKKETHKQTYKRILMSRQPCFSPYESEVG
jgi:hypothetical protein